MNLKKIRKIFEERFNSDPLIIKAPGRINLIGEHTDYNNGYVLPASIDKAIYIAIEKSSAPVSKIVAADINEEYEFKITQFKQSKELWSNYITGVVNQIKKTGKSVSNFNAVFGGDIPIGAGLSSSAALETGFAYALNILNNLELSSLEIIKYSQLAEHEFVGVRCGIMDQFASVLGKKDKVIQLDCRTLEYKYFPFNFNDISILLLNTGVSHSLASSEYDTRRRECEEGVKIIQQYESEVKSLRDVNLEMLHKYKDEISITVFKRCEYVVEENKRLLLACKKLEENDLSSFGNLMYETHNGLQNKYEVSCNELDFLVAKAKTTNGVLGSRMMGGGFGGCTINLVKNADLQNVINKISEEYKKEFGITLESYITKIVNGTAKINN
jgi:galactokinase